MPMLFALGQHRALVAIQARLWKGERIFAFVDDILVVCSPERVTDIHAIIQQELFAHAPRQNAGVEPWRCCSAGHRHHHCSGQSAGSKCSSLERSLRVASDKARVEGPWGSNWAPTECARVLETEVRGTTSSLPAHSTPQASWLLLWMCASTRANFWLRMVSPELTLPFAELHDRNVWQCLQTIMDVRGALAEAHQLASLPLTLGGLGLASAERTRHAAHCSWADCLAMVQQRHPSVAEEMIVGLDRDPAPCLAAVRHCRVVLAEANFHPPGWRDLAVVVPDRVEEVEPNQPKFSWQQCASRSLETKHLNERVWLGMSDTERALLRSQRGPLASAAVTALPTSGPQGWTVNPSAFCCSDVSGSLCLCPPAPADVAANSTHLATITQRARRQGCWVGGVSPSKLLLRRCAEKPEPVSPRTFSCRTWT